MADWLFESAPASPASLASYNVLDAVGMRFGQVDGWLRDPSGEVVMFAMTLRSLLRIQRALIPLGYITQLDLGRRNVHLREITKRSLATFGAVFEGGTLPDTDVLVDRLRQAPYVRPEIRLLLADPKAVKPMLPSRHWALGDGHEIPSAPAVPLPNPLESDLLAWTPLAPLGDDLVPSWRTLESTPHLPLDPPAWR